VYQVNFVAKYAHLTEFSCRNFFVE